MDFYMLILRLAHIFGAIFWGGTNLLMFFFVEPSLRGVGGSASASIRTYLLSKTKFPVAIAASSMITTLAGILLYLKDSNGLSDFTWIKSGQGIMFTIGGIAGIAATIIGGAMVGPATTQLTRLEQEIADNSGKATAEQAAMLKSLEARTVMAERLGVITMVIAMIFMATARYVVL